jgi:arylsulfatase
VLPSWDDLTDLDKKVGARWMEVFCAAVEHTDYQVGRIIEAIQQTGELDNTSSSTSPATTARPPRAGCTAS